MRTTLLPLATALLWAGAGSALAAVHYVDVNSTNATPPYTNWTTAATNIQDAVDAAVAGDEVVVTNGIYATGGRDGNRVKVDKPLNVRSMNGPQFTIIDGGGLVRCVYLTGGASLAGFTLTNGVTFESFGGAGVFCESQTAVVSNCVMSGNVADADLNNTHGGGASGGTLNNCTLSGNIAASGGGAALCMLNNCNISSNSAGFGGGASACTLNNCTLNDNSAGGDFGIGGAGGGAIGCTLNNCMLSGNVVYSWHDTSGPTYYGHGGGAAQCTMNNCTLAGNSAPGGFSTGGGAAQGCILNNCIAYFNTAPQGENYESSCTLSYSCTTPQPTNGFGNITNAPLFVDTNGWANLRLQSNSPCINTGNNSYVTSATDLDGNPRIVGYTVDMGAYEAPISVPLKLTITASGTNVILAWPTNYAEVVIQGDQYEAYFLYSTTNLTSPVLWSFVYSMPVVVNGQLVVTNNLNGDQRFYQIIKTMGPTSDIPCLGSGPNPCPCAYKCVSGVWTHYATCRTCDGF